MSSRFFAEKGSEDVIKEHVSSVTCFGAFVLIVRSQPESFVSLAYPVDPLTWRDSMSVKGNTKKWVTSDTQVPMADWVTDEVSGAPHYFLRITLTLLDV